MKKTKKIRKVKKERLTKKVSFKSIVIKDLKILGLILFIIMVLYLISLINSIILVFPKQSEISFDRNPEFQWIGRYNYYEFYLSRDEESSNLIIKDQVYGTKYKRKEQLGFGEYYWKVVAVENERKISSNVQRFKVESLVATEINNTLKNVGNTIVDVESFDNGVITGSAVLDVN